MADVEVADVAVDDGASDDARMPDAALSPCGVFVELLLAKRERCARLAWAPKRRADLAEGLRRLCAAYQSSPGSGFDPAFMASCGAAIASDACDRRFSFDDDSAPQLLLDEDRLGFYADSMACRVPAGTRLDGAGCYHDFECASRSCKKLGSTTCGTCEARLALGQPCTAFGSRCVTGAYCDQTQCRVRIEGALGAGCGDALGCGYELWCDTTMSQCVAPRDVGQPGGNGGNCQSVGCKPELSCVAGLCRAGGGLGAACGTFGDLPCEVGLGCNTGLHQCVVVSRVANGQGCEGLHLRCVDGSCQGSEILPRVCVPDRFTDCASGGACPPLPPTCAP